MTMVPIYRPRSNSEALVIASLLDAHRVKHLMQGGAFSSVVPGPITTSLNAQMLLVDPAQQAFAIQLLADFLDIKVEP